MKNYIKELKEDFKGNQRLIDMYNEFVDASNNNDFGFVNIKVIRQISDVNNKEGLYFDFNTTNGLTNDEAKEVFGDFIAKYPECGINFNLKEQSNLEKMLIEKSAVAVRVTEEGFMLEKI